MYVPEPVIHTRACLLPMGWYPMCVYPRPVLLSTGGLPPMVCSLPQVQCSTIFQPFVSEIRLPEFPAYIELSLPKSIHYAYPHVPSLVLLTIISVKYFRSLGRLLSSTCTCIDSRLT
ncbi:hypothetical protein EJ02DRAFT_260986 [Clathrospora elynae]|uniref:Uncharacterized protein n=1 Tax=Clathrospora elynae TaxID=706981 RepID=A0A6A5T1H4_9PLEO|nr:hypothetical protein EJ02DRAFT_260986 [Clathrospora elynae]